MHRSIFYGERHNMSSLRTVADVAAQECNSSFELPIFGCYAMLRIFQYLTYRRTWKIETI
jgi:hypothetical protein